MRPTTINIIPSKLENELVRLEQLSENDFESLFAIASDPLIWEQHPTKDRYKKAVFQLYFDGAIRSESAFLVYDQQCNELIGCTRYYDFNADQLSLAIGYTFLTRKYWGGQYNKALKHLMIDHAFQFVETIIFHIGAKNIRSQKAVLKLGATKINEIDVDYYGSKVLHYEYCIRKQDW